MRGGVALDQGGIEAELLLRLLQRHTGAAAGFFFPELFLVVHPHQQLCDLLVDRVQPGLNLEANGTEQNKTGLSGGTRGKAKEQAKHCNSKKCRFTGLPHTASSSDADSAIARFNGKKSVLSCSKSSHTYFELLWHCG